MKKVVGLFVLGLLLACDNQPAAPVGPPKIVTVAAADVTIAAGRLAAFSALPARMDATERATSDELVNLGRMLYYETRISKSGTISCNSCHNLETYGVDNKPKSPGHANELGGRNSPTVYNAAGQMAQFWDGRAKDVEEQAKGPVLNPVEMGMPSEKAVIAVLKKAPEYVAAFKAAFPGQKNPMTYDNFGVAVGAFERLLVTPSRWDKFLEGDTKALTNDEKKGFNTFIESGCLTCHAGAYVGGTMYQKLGLVVPWPTQDDLGRFDVTKQESDKMFFKTPSLRNVEKTAPYFHDGSVASLDEAVKLMAKHQVGRELSDADTTAIVTWLKALTGDVPAELIKQPQVAVAK